MWGCGYHPAQGSLMHSHLPEADSRAAIEARITPCPATHDLESVVLVSDSVMEELGIEFGDGVRIDTSSGRVACAFAERAGESELAEGSVGIGSMLRRSLRSRVHSTVSLTSLSLKELEEVALTPWIDITLLQGLHTHLETYLAGKRVAASQGMLVYAPLPESSAGSW